MKFQAVQRILPSFLSCILILGLCACDSGPAPSTLTTEAPETPPATEAPLTAPLLTPDPDLAGADYLVEIPEGEEPRILQITDTQTMRLEGIRVTSGNKRYNQVYGAFFKSKVGDAVNEDLRAWRYVREAVTRTNPHLIVMTGDVIYGQTDDSGKQWRRMIEEMDSFGIPWAVVFGNHDNESAKGVRWQIEQVQSSKYGMLKQGSVTGNCNYTVALRQGGQDLALLVMLDSNGCRTYSNPGEGMNADNVDIDLITQTGGIYEDQLQWVKDSYTAYTAAVGKQVDTYWYFHIPPHEFTTYATERYGGSFNRMPFTAKAKGDFGVTYCKVSGFKSQGFWAAAKEVNCAGMFMGHLHECSLSLVFDGIRMTFGLKTGTYDAHTSEQLGSTLMTLTDGTAKVEHVVSELKYREVPGRIST